jgi:hypothetical protein
VEPETRAYRSKIGRLPWALRNELCERMRDGATGAALVAWINAEPEARRALAALGAAPINEQNITDWRRTGYAAWLASRARTQHIREYAETAAHIAEAAGGDPTQAAARILAGKMLDMLEAVDEETAADFARAVALLRKGELDSKKVELSRRKADRDDELLTLEQQKFRRSTAEMFVKWHADHKAVAILDDASMDNDTKTEALGRLMFGDLWS